MMCCTCGEVCESKWFYVLEVPDDFIMLCGVLLCFIAAWTRVVVSVRLVVCSLSVLCLTVLVNCLLNAFAICVGR